MAGDAKGTRNATATRKTDNPNVNLGWTLSDVVFAGKLLPTPMAADGGGPRGSSAGYGLRNESRRIARQSPGATTNPASDVGSESSDDALPPQPTIWDA